MGRFAWTVESFLNRWRPQSALIQPQLISSISHPVASWFARPRCRDRWDYLRVDQDEPLGRSSSREEIYGWLPSAISPHHQTFDDNFSIKLWTESATHLVVGAGPNGYIEVKLSIIRCLRKKICTQVRTLASFAHFYCPKQIRAFFLIILASHPRVVPPGFMSRQLLAIWQHSLRKSTTAHSLVMVLWPILIFWSDIFS